MRNGNYNVFAIYNWISVSELRCVFYFYRYASQVFEKIFCYQARMPGSATSHDNDALGIRNTYFTLIFVLVAINQPFTIWMLRSFFAGIPAELDEAAQVDGCTRLQAFRRVIMPVMWPGVVTTGLFSFLLAYNDFLLSSALTNAEKMTMPAAIANAISAESEALLMQGVAGAVSITIPLIILVALFQRQIVSGLTQGAVKG